MFNKIVLMTFICIVMLTSFSQSLLASVNISYIDNTNKFTDYRLTDTSSAKSLEVLKLGFEEIFSNNMSQLLPDGYHMEIIIINIDLPGWTYVSTRIMRITGDVRYLALNFLFVIKDSAGNVLYSGQKLIEDKTKRPRLKRKFSTWKPTDLFRKPLGNWFKKTVNELNARKSS